MVYIGFLNETFAFTMRCLLTFLAIICLAVLSSIDGCTTFNEVGSSMSLRLSRPLSVKSYLEWSVVATQNGLRYSCRCNTMPSPMCTCGDGSNATMTGNEDDGYNTMYIVANISRDIDGADFKLEYDGRYLGKCRLEVYDFRSPPICDTYIEDKGTLDSPNIRITVKCNISHVYPKPRCEFHETSDNQAPSLVPSEYVQEHSVTTDEGKPVYYSRQCTMSKPVTEPVPSLYSFDVLSYPNVHDGKKYASNTSSPGLITIPSISCKQNNSISSSFGETIVCSVISVFPRCTCTFYKETKNNDTVMQVGSPLTSSPSCDRSEPSCSGSQCTLTTPISMLGPGLHRFKVNLLVDGVVGTFESPFSDTIELYYPQPGIVNCPEGESVKENVILRNTTFTCGCVLSDMGNPPGWAQWVPPSNKAVETVDVERNYSRLLIYDSIEPNPVYYCQGVSSLGHGDSLQYSPIFAFGPENVTAIISTPIVSLCPSGTKHIDIYCKVPIMAVNPKPILELVVLETVLMPADETVDSRHYVFNFSIPLEFTTKGGIFNISCVAINVLFQNLKVEDITTITVQEPPLSPPAILLNNEMALEDGQSVNVTSGLLIQVHCHVQGGFPQVTKVILSCDGVWYEAMGTELTQSMIVSKNTKECSCTAEHSSGCYNKSTTVLFNVISFIPTMTCVQNNSYNSSIGDSITCSVNAPFPNFTCAFYKETENYNVIAERVGPTLTSSPFCDRGGTPCHSKCTLTMPVSMVGPGLHKFKVSLLVDGILGTLESSFSDIIDLYYPQPGIANCPKGDSVKEDFIMRNTTATCECLLYDEGNPPGWVQWVHSHNEEVETVDVERNYSRLSIHDSTERNPLYYCQGVSSLGQGASLPYRPKIAYGPENVTAIISTSVVSLCPSRTKHKDLDVYCKVPIITVNPKPILALEDLDTVRIHVDETVDSQYYISNFLIPLEFTTKGGIFNISCVALNVLFQDLKVEDSTTITVQEPPLSPPAIMLNNEMALEDGQSVNVTSGLPIQVHCNVQGGFPQVTKVILSCDGILYEAMGTELTQIMIVSKNTQECLCTAEHASGCYNKSTSVHFNALPFIPTTKCVQNNSFNSNIGDFVVCSVKTPFPNFTCTFYEGAANNNNTEKRVGSTLTSSPSCDRSRKPCGSHCTLAMPVSMLGPGLHRFKVSLLVDGALDSLESSFSNVIDLYYPQPGIVNCPKGESVKEDFIMRNTTATCECLLSDEGNPPGWVQWVHSHNQEVETKDMERNHSQLLIFDSLEQNPTYYCQSVSSLGKGTILPYSPKIAFGPKNVTAVVSTPIVSLCQSRTKNIDVYCKVPIKSVKPKPILTLDVQDTILTPVNETMESEHYIFKFLIPLKLAAKRGNFNISCMAFNDLFQNLKVDNFTTLTSQDPPSGPPAILLNKDITIEDGQSVNVTSGLPVQVHCHVQGGFPPVSKVFMYCDGVRYEALGTELIQSMIVSKNTKECSCTAEHSSGCYNKSTSVLFNVTPTPYSMPTIRLETTLLPVKQGTPLIMACDFNATSIKQSVNVVWLFNNREINIKVKDLFDSSSTIGTFASPDNLETNTFYYESKLTIKHFTKSFAGEYGCKIKGSQQYGVLFVDYLKVTSRMVVSPAANLETSSLYVKQDSLVTVYCQVKDVHYVTFQINNTKVSGMSIEEKIMSVPFTFKATTSSDVRCIAYYNYTNGIDSLIEISNTISIALLSGDEKTCPESLDKFGNHWMSAPISSAVQGKCPKGYSGHSLRICSEKGQWGYPTFDKCMNIELSEIEEQVLMLQGIQPSNETFDVISSKLNNSLSGFVLPNDIRQVVDTLGKISNDLTEIESSEPVVTTTSLENIAAVIDLILSFFQRQAERLQLSEEQIDKNSKFAMMATKLLVAVDELVVSSLKEEIIPSKPIVMKNIIIKRGVIDNLMDVYFPSENDLSSGDLDTESIDSVFLPSNAIPGDEKNLRYSVLWYKGIQHLLPILTPDSKEKKKIQSNILTFSINKEVTRKLPKGIQLTFKIPKGKYFDPTCAFLDTKARQFGTWSSDGCRIKYLNPDSVNCICDHLTNFAILVTPLRTSPTHPTHDGKALSVASKIGCGISIVCHLCIIIVYIVLWRYMKRDRQLFLQLLISICLLSAYITFIFGWNRSTQEPVCTFVSSLLIYLLLVAFFFMLCEGVDIYREVHFVNVSQFPVWRQLFPSFGLPLLVVTLYIAVTEIQDHRMEGICWLSTSKGTFWAFVALLVILVIFVLLGISLYKMTTVAIIQRENIDKIKFHMKSLSIRSLILALTWTFGILTITDGTVVFQWLFAIFNSLQGVVMFIFFCLLSHQVKDMSKTYNVRRDTITTLLSTPRETSSGQGEVLHGPLMDATYVEESTNTEMQPNKNTMSSVV